jgi:hypothetical protein
MFESEFEIGNSGINSSDCWRWSPRILVKRTDYNLGRNCFGFFNSLLDGRR